MSTPPPTPDLFDRRTPGQMVALGMGAVASSYLVAAFAVQFLGTEPVHVISILANLAGMIAIPTLFTLAHRSSLLATTRWAPLTLGQFGWLLMIALAIIPVVLSVGEWNQRLVVPPPEYLENVEAMMPDSPGSWLLAAISIALIAPFAEELVFRGIIQQAARRVIGGVGSAIFAGVLFSIWHGQLWNLASLAIVGIVLGLVFEATGSMRAPFVVHAMYNLALLVLYSIGDGWPELPPAGVAFAATAAFAVGWAAYGRLRAARPWETQVDIEV